MYVNYFNPPTKVKRLTPLQLEVAASRLCEQYREYVCKAHRMKEEMIRVYVAIRQVPNKTYCKCTIYYSLHPDRFKDEYFESNAVRRVIFYSVTNIKWAAIDKNFRFPVEKMK